MLIVTISYLHTVDSVIDIQCQHIQSTSLWVSFMSTLHLAVAQVIAQVDMHVQHMRMYNLHRLFKCTHQNLPYMAAGKQAYTHTRVQCSLTSVGLAQAHPNKGGNSSHFKYYPPSNANVRYEIDRCKKIRASGNLFLHCGQTYMCTQQQGQGSTSHWLHTLPLSFQLGYTLGHI